MNFSQSIKQFSKQASAVAVLSATALTANLGHADVTIGDSFDVDTECNVDINEGIKVAPGIIEFGEQDNILYSIKDDKHLYIGGDKVSLSGSQQKVVTEYATQVRSDMPKILDIAKEALDIAYTAVSAVFAEVLGMDDRSISKIETAFDLANEKLESRLNSQEGVYYIGRDGMEVLDAEFDQELEHAVEDAVEDAGASMAWGILKTIFTGGANVEHEVEDKLDTKLEIKEQEIEAKAKRLCDSLVKTDALEEQLKSEVDQLKSFNVFEVTPQDQKHDNHGSKQALVL